MKKKRIIIITGLVIIILLAVAAYVLLILKDNDSNKKKSEKTINGTVKKSKYTLTGNSLEDFDLYFMQLENEKVNKIYSPLSIKYALAMLNDGAKGETRKQIENVIGDYEAKQYTNSSNLSLANAMFIKNDFKDGVKSDYIDTLKKNYNAEVVYDDFTTPDKVNAWVSEKTLKLINNLVSDISEYNFILINALAIDMDWNEKFLEHQGMWTIYAHENFKWFGPESVLGNKFNNNATVAGMEIDASLNNYDIVTKLGEDSIRDTVSKAYREYINDPANQFEVEALLGNDRSEAHINQVINDYLESYIPALNSNYKKVDYNTEFMLYVDDSVKAFAKDLKEYDGTTLQYVGIMPISEDLDSYINNMDAKKINKIIGSLKELKLENFNDGVVTRIKGFIPKFKFEYNLDLMADLKKLGINDVFDSDKSDLSHISDTKGLYVNDAIHKANIEFTQDGIKASAATFIGGRGAGGAFDYKYDVPVEKIDLTFDRPYMFIIRDKQSGEVWFAGTVYEPSPWSEDADYNDDELSLYKQNED